MDKIWYLMVPLFLAISLAAADSFVDLDDGIEIRGDEIIDDSNDVQIQIDPEADGTTRIFVDAEFEQTATFFNQLDIRDNVDMNQNDISNVDEIRSFFEQHCRSDGEIPDGRIAVDVEDDGEIVCENLDPRYYNLDGDRLEGNLDANGYTFENIGVLKSNEEPLDVEDDFRATGNVRAEGDLTSDRGVVTSETSMCIGDQC